MDPTEPTGAGGAYPETGAQTTTRTVPVSTDPALHRRHFDDDDGDGRRGPDVGVVTPYGRPGVYIYPFWQRSEFWAFILTAVAVGISAIADDTFGARSAWTLITALAAAYILSRGFAKREPRDDDDDRPWTPGGDGGRRTSGRFAR
jgi:hypothetical protein